MIASRISSMSPPVERSITVSAPYCTANCELLQLAVDVDVTAELPMFALILTLRDFADAHRLERPARWLHVGGNDQAAARDLVADRARARASSRSATKRISVVIVALARVVHLRDVLPC